MQLFTTLLTALALISWTTASPLAVAPDAIRRAEDIAIAPSIRSPNRKTIWQVGTKQLVTWDTSNIPPEAQSYTGTLVLGHRDKSGSENLDTDHPLAKGFLMTAGKHTITVPRVPTRSTYIVALIGDSGNTTPEFTIRT